MSGPEYDPEFEAYLRRRVRFDRRLHKSLARLEPPAELDRIVIGMAREAIQAPPGTPLFRAPKWAAPLAMAACLLMSFSLMLDVGLREATHHDALNGPLMVDMSPAPQVPMPESAPAPAAEPPSAATPVDSSPAIATRAAHQRVASINRVQGAPSRILARLSTAVAMATAAAPAAPPTASYASRQEEPESGHYSGGYAASPIRLAAAAPEMETVVVVGTRIHYEGQVESVAASSAISVQSLAEAGDTRVEPAIPDLPPSLLGSKAARAAARNLAGSASPATEADLRAHPDPKAWLDHIEKVRAAGLISAADLELKLFRDAYPAYPVPSELHPADGGVQ